MKQRDSYIATLIAIVGLIVIVAAFYFEFFSPRSSGMFRGWLYTEFIETVTDAKQIVRQSANRQAHVLKGSISDRRSAGSLQSKGSKRKRSDPSCSSRREQSAADLSTERADIAQAISLLRQASAHDVRKVLEALGAFALPVDGEPMSHPAD